MNFSGLGAVDVVVELIDPKDSLERTVYEGALKKAISDKCLKSHASTVFGGLFNDTIKGP